VGRDKMWARFCLVEQVVQIGAKESGPGENLYQGSVRFVGVLVGCHLAKLVAMCRADEPRRPMRGVTWILERLLQ
jgi:hypothetical protein